MGGPFVSYAQNFEDVMLWRALGHVEGGFYIDVGAYSPLEHSVTKAFYDRGWRGVNIEPRRDFHEEFLRARPRDINVNVAVGRAVGDRTFYSVGNSGLSTLDPAQARLREAQGWHVDEQTVRVETLAEIWSAYVPQGQAVQFLKVDVEGAERDVLLGNDWSVLRPWVVVVEATRPTTSEPAYEEWESILLGAGYTFAYGDGLNRFYVAGERAELATALAHPPNVFDQFERSTEVAARAEARQARERASRAEAELQLVLTSRSWRLTRPLRELVNLVRLREIATGLAFARSSVPQAALPPAGFPVPAAAPPGETGGDPRRLLIDVSVLVQVDAGTGIQRVVRSLLEWLPNELPAGWLAVPVYSAHRQPGLLHARKADAAEGGPLLQSGRNVEPRQGDVYLGLDLQQEFSPAQGRYYSELRRAGIPVYFVVYDLLPLLLPSRFERGVKVRYRRWLSLVRGSDGAICISHSVADELKRWCEQTSAQRGGPLPIAWFQLGADLKHSGAPEEPAAPLRTALPALRDAPSFLVVATVEPRKGHRQCLAAFNSLWREGAAINLVLVGKEGWQMSDFAEQIRQHPELGRRLFWFETLPDGALSTLYREVACLLAPSEGEGFGLPLVEAARYGTPILARDIPVFREVAGASASYFGGMHADALAGAVRAWLQLREVGALPRPDTTWISWQQSARQLARILLGMPPTKPSETAPRAGRVSFHA